MPLFDFSKDERANIHSIKKRTLKMILEASRSSYPEEFGAILRARKGVIHELILLPGTISGERSALFRLHNLPIDFTVVGTAHSHPSGNPTPSAEDLNRSTGKIILIAASPYLTTNHVAAYDREGRRLKLQVT